MSNDEPPTPDRREPAAITAPYSRGTARVGDALLCYLLTSLIPVLGVLAGYSLLKSPTSVPYGESEPLLRFAAWDGGQYMQILDHGYDYDRSRASNVAFFPAYPILGGGLAWLTGWSAPVALLTVGHVSLALCFLLLWRYARLRFPDDPGRAGWSLLAFGVFPTTFYFRMAYSESLFILLCLAVLYGIERRWPVPALAVLAGACTAARPVGVAAALPLLAYVLGRDRPLGRRLFEAAWVGPVAAWGLAAYMGYLWYRFDEPLAFAQTQDNFRLRPALGFADEMPRVLAWEPVWANYLPSSDAYWKRYSPSPPWWLNMQFANPIYFVAAAVAIGAGFRVRLINSYEAWLSLALLAIPYLTRSYVFCMGSQGRYAAAAVPAFLVWGYVLSRLPPPVAGSILAVWSFLLGTYAALFASWHFFV